MKNRILIFILTLLIGSCICTVSNATETGTVYLQSNYDIVEKGEEIELTVNLKGSSTAAFNLSLYFDNTKWEYVSKLDNSNVEDNHIIFVWHDTTGGSRAKQEELVKFRFKAKSEGVSTFSIDGEFYNSSGQLIKTDFKEQQVQIGKEETALQSQAEEGTNTQLSNAYLQTLRIDREGITPSFDKDNYEYYLTVPNDINNLDVLAISENPNAVVDISGNTSLKEGLNIIKIKVTSEDKKESKTYTIQVTKTANLLLANTNLEILAIENALLTPPFDANETSYNTEVSEDTQNLNVLAIPENENAEVQISGDKNLKEGDNNVTIIVTAQNGFSNKKYTVKVHKRSGEEQTKFEEEQKSQAEKVKEAYELEKTSGDSGKEDAKESGNLEVLGIIVICGIILLAAGVACWYLIIKKIKK